MPAWGTVTTSPACSVMLFFVFPDSMSSYKLIVMVSTGEEAEGVRASLMGFSWEVLGAGKSGGSAEAPLDEEGDGATAVRGFVSDFTGPELPGLAPAEPFGASESSNVISGTGRVTITSPPASLESPPASARTSRSVTWLSAWYTRGCE